MDLPDDVSIAAATLAINASGAVTCKTTALLTAEEIDQATKKSLSTVRPGNEVPAFWQPGFPLRVYIYQYLLSEPLQFLLLSEHQFACRALPRQDR